MNRSHAGQPNVRRSTSGQRSDARLTISRRIGPAAADWLRFGRLAVGWLGVGWLAVGLVVLHDWSAGSCSRADEPTSRADEPTSVERGGPVAVRPPLTFTRVHVPAGRLADVPLGGGRYVPMSAREFEEGLAGLAAGTTDDRPRATEPGLIPLADAARYTMALGDDGSLEGTVSCDVRVAAEGPAGGRLTGGGIPRELPLAGLDVRSGSLRTDAGLGEAVVFGRRDGSIALATTEPGTYTLAFRLPPEPGTSEAPRFSLPLLPALTSSVTLRLPPGLVPLIGGGIRLRRVDAVAGDADADRAALVSWQIDSGPRESLALEFAPERHPVAMLSLWTEVTVGGRQAELTAAVRPRTPWHPGAIRIAKDPAVQVTQVALATAARQTGAAPVADEALSWSVVEEGTALRIDLPRRAVGDHGAIVIRGVAPIAPGVAPLPLLRLPPDSWSGGGIVLHAAAPLSLASIDLQRCLVVPPEAAARWPLATALAPHEPALAAGPAAGEAAGGMALGAQEPRLFIEEQGPDAVVSLSLLPRTPDLDVARVTTVDLSPGVVMGRAVCDVRVQRGDVFDLTGRITPGWFVDSVEAIALPTAAESSEAARRRDTAEPAAGLDWKVLRDARGDVLRIGLTAAATPARGLGLRITGHRKGIALREDFSTAEIDMVRFDGEVEKSAVVDLRTSPETTVEFEPGRTAVSPDDIPAVEPDGRLAALMEEGAARARMWAGFRAESRTARLVRRRPPLDARAEVRLTVRDDRLTESITFECHPTLGDLDSIVVQFSTPLDDLLDWSLLPPAVGNVSARRLDASDRRGGSGAAAGAERWLVELNPPARGTVTIRAARTVPFVQPTPVLLAWVDGSTSAIGHCVVRNVGRTLPRVVNRRLTVVPPETVAASSGRSVVAEFSFDPSAAAETGEAAAELVPVGDVGRAWAWRETTSSWCHASGATEHETFFSIENHGRASLSLTLPAGHRVQGIVLDGVRLPLGERAAAGGPLPIELPAGRSLVNLLVRTVVDPRNASRRVGAGAWSAWAVEAPGVKLDVPVMQREWRLFLPPELVVAFGGGAVRDAEDAVATGWVERLLGATVRQPAESVGRPAHTAAPLTPTGDVVEGFRGLTVVSSAGTEAAQAVVVVGGRVVSTTAACVGIAAAVATLLAARASFRAAFLLCLLAAVSALWTASPFDAVARAGWWGTLGGLTLAASGWWPAGGRRRRADGAATGVLPSQAVALLAVAFVLHATAAVAAPDDEAAAASAPPVAEAGVPLQVFITPAAGSQPGPAAGDATVLVPEELFRALVRGERGDDSRAVRVLVARVDAAVPADGEGSWPAWRLTVDIEADGGGSLLIDQSASGGRFQAGSLRVDGGPAAERLEENARRLRVVFPDAGRHTMTVTVEPASRRQGDTETATISLPAAPVASLAIPPPGGRPAVPAVICEAAVRHGRFQRPPRPQPDAGGTVFDISRSTAVRLVRSLTAGVELATLPPAAVSRNDIFWNLDECRLNGVYEIDPGDAVARSCVVRADPGLEWIEPPGGEDGRAGAAAEPESGVSILPLGNQRYLVERRRPERGRFRFEIPFRMPLADSVGVFAVPEAWVEETRGDERSVRFVASPSLAVRIDLPAGLSHAAVPDGEASFETRFWRDDWSRATAPAGRPRAQLTSHRRHQEIRGSQRETVVFAGEQVRMHLDARIDASSTALVTIPIEVPQDAVLDRVELAEDDVLHPEAAGRGAIDLRWSRVADTHVVVVVQRPRAGRFRLEVDARIPGRPAARGPLPCVRVGLADGSRTVVEWRAEDGLEATLDPSAAPRAPGASSVAGLNAGQCEIVAGDPPPSVLTRPSSGRSPREDADEPPAVRAADDAIGRGRVELADVRLAVDARGRMWGLASFEVMPVEELVRIRLPRSWRLFDTVVDGRPVECDVPAGSVGDNVWELRLPEVGMPCTIVTLFRGELFGGDRMQRLLDGEPIALTPPAIVGLSCSRVIWTLQLPPGQALRVAAPARSVGGGELEDERRAAQRRLADDFQRAIATSVGWRQDRVRAFAESRRHGATPDADAAWTRAVSDMAAVRSMPIGILPSEAGDGADGAITIRAVRQRDPTVGGRAIATLALLSCAGLVWLALRGAWSLPRAMGLGLVALGATAAGVAWLLTLEPAWPGVAWITGGVATALRIWPVRRRGSAREAVPPYRTDRADTAGRAERAARAGRAERGLATTVYRPREQPPRDV